MRFHVERMIEGDVGIFSSIDHPNRALRYHIGLGVDRVAPLHRAVDPFTVILDVVVVAVVRALCPIQQVVREEDAREILCISVPPGLVRRKDDTFFIGTHFVQTLDAIQVIRVNEPAEFIRGHGFPPDRPVVRNIDKSLSSFGIVRIVIPDHTIRAHDRDLIGGIPCKPRPRDIGDLARTIVRLIRRQGWCVPRLDQPRRGTRHQRQEQEYNDERAPGEFARAQLVF